MKSSKFIGGSRLAQFRLPIEGYKSTRARVQALLDQIAKEMQDNDEKGTKSMTASAKTGLGKRICVKPTKALKEGTVYSCGCTVIDGLFRRQAGCSKAKMQH